MDAAISTFFSMMLFPHMTAGFAAMIAAILLMLKAWRPDGGTVRRRAAAAAGAGLVLSVLTLFHPFDTVTALCTIRTFPVLIGLAERRWPRAEAFPALVASLVVAPAIAYDLYLVSTNRRRHEPGVERRNHPGALQRVPGNVFFYVVSRAGCGESALARDGTGQAIPNGDPCPSTGQDADGDGVGDACA